MLQAHGPAHVSLSESVVPLVVEMATDASMPALRILAKSTPRFTPVVTVTPTKYETDRPSVHASEGPSLVSGHRLVHLYVPRGVLWGIGVV